MHGSLDLTTLLADRLAFEKEMDNTTSNWRCLYIVRIS